MPEQLSDKTVFTLLEVTKSIKKTLSERYANAFWVKAEMHKLNYYPASGHAYPELVEKQDGRVVAQMRSNLWRDDYKYINNKFLATLKEPLKEGIKVLLLAKINFDPAYGLALQVLDIDPAYTLGDLEKEKQETLDRLRQEGIFNRNKLPGLPLLPQRIAVISVETSKGYADFREVIDKNEFGYRFFYMLFPSLLQGEKAVDDIIGQLHRVKTVKGHFDAVAIIRGGGSDIGLSCYNHYRLAREIALFPLPVLTGIGHATNETVAEMVSFSNAITPTRLAADLIERFHAFAGPVNEAETSIADKATRLLVHENARFRAEIKLFRSAATNILAGSRSETEAMLNILVQTTKFGFMRRAAELEAMDKNIQNMSPQQVLKRGYSITLLNGKAVKSSKELAAGMELETVLLEGKISSIVKPLDKPQHP